MSEANSTERWKFYEVYEYGSEPKWHCVSFFYVPRDDEVSIRPLKMILDFNPLRPDCEIRFRSEGGFLKGFSSVIAFEDLDEILETVTRSPLLDAIVAFLRHVVIKNPGYDVYNQDDLVSGHLCSGLLCCTLCDKSHRVGVFHTSGFKSKVKTGHQMAYRHFFKEHYNGSFTKGAARE